MRPCTAGGTPFLRDQVVVAAALDDRPWSRTMIASSYEPSTGGGRSRTVRPSSEVIHALHVNSVRVSIREGCLIRIIARRDQPAALRDR